MRNLLILISITSLLSGCAWFLPDPPPPPKTILIAPEDKDIIDCAITPPPNKKEYNEADDFHKLFLLTQAYNAQTSNIDDCNIRLYGVRIWKEEQLKIYKDK